MALLALTLALLAMTVATTAYMKRRLDMAPDSFDDQYQNCSHAMRAELPALNRSEFQNNPLFAKVWPWAVAEWQRRGSPVSPLSSSAPAITIMAYTMDGLYEEFNDEVRLGGRFPQEYRDGFHYKTLHFLLTDALATLRDAQKEQECRCVSWGSDKYLYTANVGDAVLFGRFVSASLCENVTHTSGTITVFKVQACHGAHIKAFSEFPKEEEVLIPPFEMFNVTKVIEGKESVRIHLESIGTYSKYNCEWLKGGSVPMAPSHLGKLLLATTVLAMATGIL